MGGKVHLAVPSLLYHLLTVVQRVAATIASEGENAMGWLAQWWRQSDHYDRLSAHLAARGMDTLTRITISIVAGGLALVALGTIWTPTGPKGPVAR